MGKYFTEAERYQLEGFLKAKMKQKDIAHLLNKSPRTIRREIERGTITLINQHLMEYECYCADVAQARYNEKKTKKGRKAKLPEDSELVSFLKEKIIEDKYSPYAAMATIKKENKIFSVTFCLKTLYNAIASGVIGITRTHLHINSKRKPYKKKQKKFIRPVLPHRTSIENRPNSINDRLVLNHWEMDTVVSGQAFNKCALLVLTERKTNKSIIRKIQAKTQNEVISVLDHLEKGIHNFKDIFRSITMDNGTEFLNYNGIEMSPFTGKKRTTTYYCHPYSAYERGQNENINKLIRYFIPKGSDISKYTDVFIQHVEDWINNYPRQKYNGLSANELYHLYVSGYNP